VDSSQANEILDLVLLESVQCLGCGVVYGKPTGGGTVRENPGCPECGYVGWVLAKAAPFSEAWMRSRSVVHHLPRLSG
jgi:hypothetical protein